jgi:molybdopterin molybdotransferase
MTVMSQDRTEPIFDDPRGRGFRSRVTVEHVRSLIDEDVAALPPESVKLDTASRRVLAETVVADLAVPHFARAAMDGFALIAAETFGADAYTPAVFSVIGRSRPGSPFDGHVAPGEAVAIATGAPMPAGADAVVPVEAAEAVGPVLKVRESVTPGRHVGRVGEDIEIGRTVLSPGRVLRPQDLGVLSSLGRSSVLVRSAPRIGIMTTGDELLPPGTTPSGFRIPDMNAPMLTAAVVRDGGSPTSLGPIPDDEGGLSLALNWFRERNAFDAIFVCGGSSTGPEDFGPKVVRSIGVLRAHGVALRPASPTGYGLIRGMPVLLLPGNPVSCLCAYDFFGSRIVRRLGGRSVELPYPRRRMPLESKIVSVLGRVDYVRVRFLADGLIAPISAGGASILSGATAADGFVIVPADSEGYPPGTILEAFCYDIP